MGGKIGLEEMKHVQTHITYLYQNMALSVVPIILNTYIIT